LTTANGRKDYAIAKEHAELIAKPLKATAKNAKPASLEKIRSATAKCWRP
jgi:hypothetical protein